MPNWNTRQVGRTALRVTEIGLGTATMARPPLQHRVRPPARPSCAPHGMPAFVMSIPHRFTASARRNIASATRCVRKTAAPGFCQPKSAAC